MLTTRNKKLDPIMFPPKFAMYIKEGDKNIEVIGILDDNVDDLVNSIK